MGEKVALPRDVADAIGRYLVEFDKPALIEAKCDYEGEWESGYTALDKIDVMTLAAALVNGYEVERTPEERLREYYERLRKSENHLEHAGQSGAQFRQGWQSVRETLEILSADYPELAHILDETRKPSGIECPKCGAELHDTYWVEEGRGKEFGYICGNCGYELREGLR